MSRRRCDARQDIRQGRGWGVRASGWALAAMLGTWVASASAQHPAALTPADGELACETLPEVDRGRCLRREEARSTKAHRASRAYHFRLADRLAADGGARNLALAANLRALALAGDLFHSGATLPRLAGDARLAAWTARAAHEAQGDPFVLSLLIRPFSPGDDPRRRAVRDALQLADPANLAAFPDDEAQVVVRLAEAGEGSRFDLHYGALLRATLDAVERHPPGARHARWLLNDDTPTLRAYAILLSFAMMETPRFVPIIEACRGDALALVGRRETCVRYGAVLADGSDTLLAHMFGLAILHNSATDAETRECIEARRRKAAWVSERWRVLGENDPVGFNDWQADALRASPGIDEMTLMRKALEAYGVPLEPPAEFRHTPMPSP